MASIADRMNEALLSKGWSQSELARRVGVTQGAISQIALGTSRRSKHLPEIARHLGVQYEWLIGLDVAVGDDRDDAESSLSADELSLVRGIRALQARDRSAVMKVAEGFLESRSVGPVVADLPDEDLLTAIFDALLAGIADSEPRLEKARLLARRLPIGLAQARGVRLDPPVADHPAAAPPSPEAPATRRSAPVP